MQCCLVTRQNPDGTFDNVGGNNRTLVRLKTVRGVIKRLVRWGWVHKGDTIRLDRFSRVYDTEPYKTSTVVIGA